MKKIRSINDVITNSSDETYIVKSELTPNEMLALLREHLNPEESCSGMGGILEVYSNTSVSDNAKYGRNSKYMPNGFLALCIDNGFESIKKFAKDELNAITEYSEDGDSNIISDIKYIKCILDYITNGMNYEKEKLQYPELYDVLQDNIKKLIDTLTKKLNKIIMYIIDDYDLNEFNPEDYVNEIPDATIKDEYLRRFGRETTSMNIMEKFASDVSKFQLHDMLADIAGLMHTATNEEIFKALNDKI